MKRVFLPMALMIMGVFSPTVTSNAETLYMDNVSAIEEYTELVLMRSSQDDIKVPGGPRRAKSRKTIYSSVEVRLLNGVLIFNNYSDIYDAEICICDEHGDIVVSSIIDIIASDDNTIDISPLSSGYYTLYVTIDGVEYYATFEM